MIDLGNNHKYEFVCWKPDRNLNPQYSHIPDIEKCAIIIYHKKIDGSDCCGVVHLESKEVKLLWPENHIWKVESWEPLTLSPSILCKLCGDHGFIRNGVWVNA